jgi:hypothetical protein
MKNNQTSCSTHHPRLCVMMWLQYFVWGAWLETCSSYMVAAVNSTGARQFPNNYLRAAFLLKRRARDSNPQPVSRHLISSQAANHSLTLPADSYQFIGPPVPRQGKPFRGKASRSPRPSGQVAAVIARKRCRPQNCYFPRCRNDPTRTGRVHIAHSFHPARPPEIRSGRRTHSGFDGLPACDCCNSRRRFPCSQTLGGPIRSLSSPSSRLPSRRSHR